MAVPVLASNTITVQTADEITGAKPSGTTTGDLLVAKYVFIADTPGSSLTLPSGWSLVSSTVANPFRYAAVAVKPITNGGTEPASYSFAMSGESGAEYYCFLELTRVTGADLVSPINVSALAVDLGSSSNVAFSAVTTTVADCLILCTGYATTVNPTGSEWPNATTTGLTVYSTYPALASQPGAGNYLEALYGSQVSPGSFSAKTIAAATSAGCWYAFTIAIAPATTNTLTPGSGSLVITGRAPAIVNDTSLSPGAGTLVLTGYAPTIVNAAVLSPGSGSLTITGYAPLIVTGGVTTLTPGRGSLVITGYAPSITFGEELATQIPIIQNLELTRRQINAILARLFDAQPGYGADFPANALDGKMFVKSGALYQLQAGVWVAI